MKIIETIYNPKKDRRLQIIMNDEKHYTFRVEKLSDDALGMIWIPYGNYSKCLCDDLETLYRELERVEWFKKEMIQKIL